MLMNSTKEVAHCALAAHYLLFPIHYGGGGLTDTAIIVVLAFHCILRVSELSALTASCIHLAAKVRRVVSLQLTKSGQRRGAQEHCTIYDPAVGYITARLLASLPPRSKLTH